MRWSWPTLSAWLLHLCPSGSTWSVLSRFAMGAEVPLGISVLRVPQLPFTPSSAPVRTRLRTRLLRKRPSSWGGGSKSSVLREGGTSLTPLCSLPSPYSIIILAGCCPVPRRTAPPPSRVHRGNDSDSDCGHPAKPTGCGWSCHRGSRAARISTTVTAVPSLVIGVLSGKDPGVAQAYLPELSSLLDTGES